MCSGSLSTSRLTLNPSRWLMSRPTEAPRVPITWRVTDPSPAQLAAWEWLWRRLLQGEAHPQEAGSEMEEPQAGKPGAATVTAVESGCNLNTDGHVNGTTEHVSNI